jgi:hypothetical protein
MPPDVVRTLASSTVFVKASSLVNLDFAGIVAEFTPQWLSRGGEEQRILREKQ